MSNARDKANIPALNFSSTGIDDNATSTAVTIDSSGNVGIGTSAIDGKLHLDDGATTKLIIEKDGSGAGSLIFHNDGTQTSYIQLDASEDMVHYGGSGVNQIFYSGGSERLRITSTGNVGIGESNPGYNLVVDGGANTTIRVQNDTPYYGDFQATTTGIQIRTVGSYPLIFNTNQTERMRIDASGNVLVGKTSDNFADVGVVLSSSQANAFTRDDGNVVAVRRNTSDGNALLCYKDTTNTGGLIVRGNEIIFFSAHHGHGVRFAEEFVATDGTGNNNDNDIDLGKSGVRWRTVFAGTGSINTSDENEKQSIQPLTSSEMNVAKRLSALFKKYKFNDAVEQKGDNARTHTGIIAQDVQQAFTDEGLDASNYALWCSDTWYQDANGDIKHEPTEGYVEKTRLALRYSELFSFIQAYNDQRFTELEARITTLETNNP